MWMVAAMDVEWVGLGGLEASWCARKTHCKLLYVARLSMGVKDVCAVDELDVWSRDGNKFLCT